MMMRWSGDHKCLDCIEAYSNDVRSFAVNSCCNSFRMMAIAMTMTMASTMLYCRTTMNDDAVEIVMKDATARLLNPRAMAAFHVNLSVCVDVHDDWRTKLVREPLLISSFVLILHANKRLDNGSLQMNFPALAIVHWWMWYVNDVVYVSMRDPVQSQYHFHRPYRFHRHMKSFLCKARNFNEDPFRKKNIWFFETLKHIIQRKMRSICMVSASWTQFKVNLPIKPLFDKLSECPSRHNRLIDDCDGTEFLSQMPNWISLSLISKPDIFGFCLRISWIFDSISGVVLRGFDPPDEYNQQISTN